MEPVFPTWVIRWKAPLADRTQGEKLVRGAYTMLMIRSLPFLIFSKIQFSSVDCTGELMVIYPLNHFTVLLQGEARGRLNNTIQNSVR